MAQSTSESDPNGRLGYLLFCVCIEKPVLFSSSRLILRKKLEFLNDSGLSAEFQLLSAYEKTIKTASFIKVDHGAARGIKGLFDQISHTKVIFLIWNG